MANKFTTKVTNEGVTLLQEASQQDKKVEFINAIASSTAYSESQLISETYDDINGRASKNQTGTINNITIGKNITRMELVFDGHDVKSDYTLNSIFLIAKLKDSQDLKLFAVIKANQPQYMNSYDGSGSTNLQINLGIKFSNNDRVTLQVDTAAIATLGDLSNLRNETQTKLDKETSRATEKETSLQKDLEIEKNRANQSEIELQNKIDSEVSRAQKTEKDLTASLSAEKNRAIQAENHLSGIITTEQNRAMSRENYIDVKIDKEKDRATSKENEIANNIQFAANDARTNAKNDAITAIKSDNQWQSMGNIITNSPFLQNSDGFAQEVVKTAIPMVSGGGVNLVRNSGNPQNTDGWQHTNGSHAILRVTKHPYWKNNQENLFLLINRSTNGGEAVFNSDLIKVDRNTDYTLSYWAFKDDYVPNSDTWFFGRKNGETSNFTVIKQLIKERRYSGGHAEYVSVTFNTEECDEGYIRFDNNGNSGSNQSGLYIAKIKLEKSTVATPWSPAPEDLATKLQLNQVIYTINNTISNPNLLKNSTLIDEHGNPLIHKNTAITSSRTMNMIYLYDASRLNVGKKYTISIDYKVISTNGKSGTSSLDLRRIDDNKGQLGSDKYIDLGSVRDWTRFSTTFTLTEDLSPYVVTLGTDTKEFIGEVWYKNIKLEEGEVATPYNP